MLMGCSKGSVVRLAPSSLLCAQTGRACPGLCAWAPDCARGPVDDGARLSLALEVRDCARGPVDDGVRLSLALEVRDCARGPVDDGVRVPGTVRVGQWTTGCAGLELCARAPLLAALTH